MQEIYIEKMTIEERIVLFSTLGKTLKSELSENNLEDLFFVAKSKNQWFTSDNIKQAFEGIIENYLSEDALRDFVSKYPISHFAPVEIKKVGIVAAGNIPLVGFQDILHVLLSGHIVLVKPSSQDEILIQFILKRLKEITPDISEFFYIVDKLNDADAFIATGSGNSSRYFEYYFAKKPNIIRKNRTSVAVLDGTENKIQIAELAQDIFSYFGLGCRNVSKLYVPKGYNFNFFFESIEFWSGIMLHSKYTNNYEYMKAIYLVNRVPHLDNGFILLKEDEGLASPISTLFYQEYDTEDELKGILEKHKNDLQVVIGNEHADFSTAAYGYSQKPNLDDYADGINTFEFLAGLN
jgi:hypothetical protein